MGAVYCPRCGLPLTAGKCTNGQCDWFDRYPRRARSDMVQRLGIIGAPLVVVYAIWWGSWFAQLAATVLVIGTASMRWLDQKLIEVQRSLIDLYRREP